MIATTNVSKILWLGDRACDDPAQVGGKSAHLSCLAADYRVPTGFCLTAAAFDPDYSADASLPTALTVELADAYEALARRAGLPDVPVAVRSSALDEDGDLASFAGQHETELNLVGVDNVLGAIVRCWASGCNERALAYRKQQGLDTEEVRLAVLVQQLVAADTSSVIFSANPISGNRNEVVVTASWGLGESVVSGTVTPDTWVVRKADLAVKEERIGSKERMTVAVAGGTREVAVPRLLQERSSLSRAQVAEVAKLAMELEEKMGRPVDVETAFAGDLLHLLQCRPITTLDESSLDTRATV
ncbi:MAG: PEP/pyruvate-binding domain-containing protein [Actinobacteria bacterium]|nr:PEP/pyruvate-binding domain-containing protein [Actinomycetota bacterium]